MMRQHWKKGTEKNKKLFVLETNYKAYTAKVVGISHSFVTNCPAKNEHRTNDKSALIEVGGKDHLI